MYMSELIVSKFRPLCERLYRCSTINFPDRHFTVDELVKVWESTEDGYNLLSQRVKEVEARTPGIGFPECKMDMVAFGDVVILREI